MRIKRYFLSGLSGFTVATLLWVLGPVYRVVRNDPELTFFDYVSWVMASNESKFILTATLAALVLMISSIICRHVWSRINVGKDLNINRRAAEIDTREYKLKARQHAFDDYVLTTKENSEREAQAIIAHAKKESLRVLNGARQESAAIMERARVEADTLKSRSHEEYLQILDCARQEAAKIITQANDHGARTDRSEHKIHVKTERFSQSKSVEPEFLDKEVPKHGQSEIPGMLDQANVLIEKYGLSGRQAKGMAHISKYGDICIQTFERLNPQVSRRTLQRDLKGMVDMGLLISEGSSHHVTYRIKT